MLEMKCYTKQIQVATEQGVGIVDITAKLQEAVQESGIANGSLQAFCIGSTGSLTCIEYEPGVVADLARSINELAPPGREYEHEKAWMDGNGHSHVQAALIGPSLDIPIRDGNCALGTWQQVVAINHDVGARTRRIEITAMGSGW
ncbi:MAG: secondary thiamine-phosphate synthase enzyme YjbQ [Thermodesulfobacteriota bacterium]